MADELDALLDGAGGDAPETPEQVAQPDSQAATAEAQAKKLAELDAVVPESPDIDKGYWGKPVAEVIRVADQHKHEAGVAATRNQQWNQLVALKQQADAEAAYWRQMASGGQQPPQTKEQRLQRLQETPVEELDGMMDQRVTPLQERLQRTEQRLIAIASENAREQARQYLNIPPETWNGAAPMLANYIHVNQWDSTDPRVWAYAGEQYRATAAAWVQPAPQPSTAEVPRSGAPPVGGARSQVRQVSPQQLRGADKDLVGDLNDVFGLAGDSAKSLESYAASRKGLE